MEGPRWRIVSLYTSKIRIGLEKVFMCIDVYYSLFFGKKVFLSVFKISQI
jgi:hypothetical protein